MPESRHLKNGEILSLALANVTIRNLSSIEPILQALRYVMALVGVRAANLPNDYEKAILVNYIQKHYSGHTPEEIKLAFEMAIAGYLELLGEVTCYENFSVLYFSTIMNAYRSWAKDAYDSAQVSTKELSRLPTKEQIIHEAEQTERSHIETFYQQIIQITKKIPDQIPDYFTSRLIADGLMKQGENAADFIRNKIENGSHNIYVYVKP